MNILKKLPMVQIAALFISFFYFTEVFSQSPRIDSLRSVLQKEKVDSNRVTLLWNLAEQYQFFKPDTTIQLAQQAQLIARRIKFTEGESRSFAVMATGQYLLGNYTASLNNYTEKLKIEEKRNSVRNYASALNNIGLIYILLSDYTSALSYLYRADSTVNAAGGQAKQELENSILTNLGETFYRMKNHDSANHYFSEALDIALQNKNGFYQAAAFVGLGNVYASKGSDSSALLNYRQGLAVLNEGTNNDLLCEAALGFANVFQKKGQNDSVLHYATLAIELARRNGFLSRELDAANFLSLFYKGQNNPDSAFAYLEQAVVLQDSLKGQAKTREAMIISSSEQIRQAEIAEQKVLDKQARLQQLQLLAICIFIPIFFILTVAVSRRRIQRTVVRFMGVVSLLMFFEFIILLLHPIIADLMHHNKVLELLVLVCIGAGLVPLHHRLEHIVLERLTKGTMKPTKAIDAIVETTIVVNEDYNSNLDDVEVGGEEDSSSAPEDTEEESMKTL
jgi:tetratricopeptide (TPR) repeat protein